MAHEVLEGVFLVSVNYFIFAILDYKPRGLYEYGLGNNRLNTKTHKTLYKASGKVSSGLLQRHDSATYFNIPYFSYYKAHWIDYKAQYQCTDLFSYTRCTGL